MTTRSENQMNFSGLRYKYRSKSVLAQNIAKEYPALVVTGHVSLPCVCHKEVVNVFSHWRTDSSGQNFFLFLVTGDEVAVEDEQVVIVLLRLLHLCLAQPGPCRASGEAFPESQISKSLVHLLLEVPLLLP